MSHKIHYSHLLELITDRLRPYGEDILWDSEDCLSTSNCCELNRPPYFIKDLAWDSLLLRIYRQISV